MYKRKSKKPQCWDDSRVGLVPRNIPICNCGLHFKSQAAAGQTAGVGMDFIAEYFDLIDAFIRNKKPNPMDCSAAAWSTISSQRCQSLVLVLLVDFPVPLADNGCTVNAFQTL